MILGKILPMHLRTKISRKMTISLFAMLEAGQWYVSYVNPLPAQDSPIVGHHFLQDCESKTHDSSRKRSRRWQVTHSEYLVSSINQVLQADFAAPCD